jgi:hypothetical protein
VSASNAGPYRIGFLNPWREKAENQAYQSLSVAAKRIGHELVHVANSDHILAADLDFVLAVASTQPKTTALPTFGVIHEPRERFWQDEAYFQNLFTYDGYLTIADTLNRFLKAFCAGAGKPGHIGFYFNTPQRQALGCELRPIVEAGVLRLCYFGTNWDPRARPLFRALSKRPYFRVYGPEDAWAFLEGEAYCGSLPFDGQSVQRAYAQFGAGLVTLSRHHLLDDVISNRIFEIASVGAVAICPDIPWIRKHFGETVFYYDAFARRDVILDRIDRAMAAIAADPKAAGERAKAARAIFDRQFSAEIMLANAVRYYEEWRDGEGRPQDPASGPLIDVVMRVGGRPAATILRAIGSIEAQTEGRFRVIFVRYRALDLDEITAARWSRIEGFKIIDRPGGGRADTLTAGLKAVESELFAVLDDDDFWLPGHIAGLLAQLGQCPPGRAYAYSGYLAVEEPPPGEEAGAQERRRIASLAPAAGGLDRITATFAPHSWIASSALLREIDLDGWTLATAEDSVVQASLMSCTVPQFSWRATACSVRGSQGASNFANTDTRAEDVFECYLRVNTMIDRLERNLPAASMSSWERLRLALQEILEAKTATSLDMAATVLALEEGVRTVSMHERDDIETRPIRLARARFVFDGDSRLVEHEGAVALLVAPPAVAWAYGARLHLDPVDLFRGEQWIVLEFAALAEPIGVGLLNRAGDDFVTRMELPVSELPVEAWLHVRDREDLSAVVLQNWAAPTAEPRLLRRAWLVREQ